MMATMTENDALVVSEETVEALELETVLLDSVSPAQGQTNSGFRLSYLELYNWGTFNGQVCRLSLDGKNGLLTGDIGSGKSTVVDAITTLLVPAHRVAYNKAAGADIKERNLRSYVQGYYKSERNEMGGSSKPVALRDSSSYTVILGVFENPTQNQTISIAQVFWTKDAQGQPQRFFVGVEDALTITNDFSNFGSDPARLKKQLRSKHTSGEIFESFPPYGAWFRRRFGIENEQALDLFHQTVSMKSVGNLTDFVRGHMLEAQDIRPQIEGLITHFEDLNSAHEAVLKASRQVEMLSPLVAQCQAHAEINSSISQSINEREALKTYFNLKKIDLLDQRIKAGTEDLTALNIKIDRYQNKVDQQRLERDKLKESINDNGGNRLSKLTAEITTKLAEVRERKSKAERYAGLAKIISLNPEPDEDAFARQLSAIAEKREVLKNTLADKQNEQTDLIVEVKQLRSELSSLLSEIESLRARRSNIPRKQIAIREELCQALNLKEEDLPFAGELLQIKESESLWEGAAERAMHSFALGMLVPDKIYPVVADYVDRTHLGGRLTYYRERKQSNTVFERIDPNTLAGKIAIKPDTQHYDWLEKEVAHRFDYFCCNTQEEFRKHSKAITRAGQIKSKDDRHDKDDRHRIDDRSRFVLGWSNAEKLKVLLKDAADLESQGAKLAQQIEAITTERTEIDSSIETLNRLDEYKTYREIDWQTVADEITHLESEKTEIERSSNILMDLNNRLLLLEQDLAKNEDLLSSRKSERAKLEDRMEKSQEDKNSLSEECTDELISSHRPCFANLDIYFVEVHGDIVLTIESSASRESTLREKLQAKLDNLRDRLGDIQKKIVVAMQKYRSEFPLETAETDASIEAASEYKEMLESLQADDLPRFRSRFKELLNENTIREVANFQMHLHRERENIKERISNINESLTQIDYNPDRYILLEAQPSQDADLRDFQSQLKACTEGAFTAADDSQYSEEKFLQVKAIIERFKGREGQTDLDKKWTNRVTDVRNWYTFAASERWRENDEEHEHYSDSGGKSGGQKEKLAYTILAASLAYQFGLSWVESRSKSFRFVVIDEAFGRGSDDSARYGLTLFDKLNLQLLVVTPMQKINIIEPFVSSVGYVHNTGGQSSRLRNMTIEEYRDERAKRAI